MTPSISVMIAGSLGLRASKSSTTRGRPPVMSLVLVVAPGTFARMSLGGHVLRVVDYDVGTAREQVLPSSPLPA